MRLKDLSHGFKRKVIHRLRKELDALAPIEAKGATKPSSGSKRTLPTKMAHERVPLSTIEIPPVVRNVRDFYERTKDTRGPGGSYLPDDWERISFSLSLVESGGTILDVGIGAGQLVNTYATSKKFTRVVGLDYRRVTGFASMGEEMETPLGDVTALPFADNSFDVVTCFEVLEHLQPEQFGKAISELRRVAKNQLLVSVPFAEPEPIYHGHYHRFVEDDVRRWFPESKKYLLTGTTPRPWILIEERTLGSDS